MTKKRSTQNTHGMEAREPSRRALPQQVALYMRVSSEDQAERGTIDACASLAGSMRQHER
jgi:hypothetical protein